MSWKLMNIVVLDGFVMNPGDMSWAPLERMGSLTVHDRTPPDQTAARAHDADILLTNKTRLSTEVIRELPRLRFISLLSTGCDMVDRAAARARGILVIVPNCPSVP
jgi:glycerate dehydrogenase